MDSQHLVVLMDRWQVAKMMDRRKKAARRAATMLEILKSPA